MQVIIDNKEYNTKKNCIGIKFLPVEVKELLNNLSKDVPIIKVKSDKYRERKLKFPELFQKLKALLKYKKFIKNIVDIFVYNQYERRFPVIESTLEETKRETKIKELK